MEARAEEQMKLDFKRQRQDAQRNNNMMTMMLGSVMGKKMNPEAMYGGPFNFSSEREGTEENISYTTYNFLSVFALK